MYRCLPVVIAAVISASVEVRSSELEDSRPKVEPVRIKDVPRRNVPLAHFHNFSWRAFIALNWPALPGEANRGKADTSKKFADSGPRVWETWKARHEVFAPDASEPADWNKYDGANPCGGVNSEVKTLNAFNHFTDLNQGLASPFTLGNPLVAQNRTYTRYEVRFNEKHFDTIRQNKWYIAGNLPTADNPGTFKNGSIQIKAAWRILNSRDSEKVRKRFYVVHDALVFDPDATGSVLCTKQDVALVGFHIVIKTPERPQWIWSSFEHIDNVPPHSDEPDAKAAGVPYSYHSDRPPNGLSPAQPPPPITKENYSSNPEPMQVVRKQRIRPDVMAMNKAYWDLPEIKETIWEKYMLVMTQWPTAIPAEIPPSPDRNGFPQPVGLESTLANTTMETYQQRAEKSCMECHHDVSNKRGLDFVAYMGMLLSRRR
jgi:hypothetical protein